jgi:hypothetical protein
MKLETGLDWLAGWFFHLSVGMIGILPVFSLPRKGKNKKKHLFNWKKEVKLEVNHIK